MFKPEQQTPDKDGKRISQTERAEEPANQLDNLSVADIKKYTEDLKQKIDAVKQEKERDVEQKLAEREILIGEDRSVEELFLSAREALDYYTAMKDLGQLTDKTDEKKLQELQSLVDNLEKQQVAIAKKLTAIESRPEIINKVWEEAEKENLQFDVRQEFADAMKLFSRQIDEMAEAIKQLADKIYTNGKQEGLLGSKVDDNWKSFNDLLNQTRNMLGKKSDYAHELNTTVRQNYSHGELGQALMEARKSLGLFSGKEKAAIDFIIKSPAFIQYKRLQSEIAYSDEQKKILKEEKNNLAEQFRTLFLKIWESQNKINDPGKIIDGRGDDLVYKLSEHLARRIESYLGEAMGETEKMIDWGKVYANPRAHKILNVFQDIKDDELIRKNPRLK